MFLSCLNEVTEGCEKILPVSLSFWNNLKLSKMMFLAGRLILWMISERKSEFLRFFPSVTFAAVTVGQS